MKYGLLESLLYLVLLQYEDLLLRAILKYAIYKIMTTKVSDGPKDTAQ